MTKPKKKTRVVSTEDLLAAALAQKQKIEDLEAKLEEAGPNGLCNIFLPLLPAKPKDEDSGK